MAAQPTYTKTWHTSSYPSISPSRPELSLAGKSIVLTGGGSGIGLSIAKSIALAGASQLAIIGRRSELLTKAAAEIRALVDGNIEVFAYSADVADKAQVDAAFEAIHAKFSKPLDGFVSNAGFFTGLRPYGTETVEEWQENFNVNVLGVYFVSSAFAKYASPNAIFINIATALVHLPREGFNRVGFSSHISTKTAAVALIKSFQAEHPGFHTVSMHPGRVTGTDLAAKFFKGPRDPIDDPGLSGDFIVWLMSAEAKFLKGKFVWANWDVDELKANAKEIESTSQLTLGLNGWSS